MSKLSKILASLALILGFGAIAMPAYAEEGAPVFTSEDQPTAAESISPASITLMPTNQNVPLKPGEVVEKELVVSNEGNVSYRFRLYAQPYTINDSENQYSFAFNTMNSYTSIYNWVTFKQDDGTYSKNAVYTINAGEKKTISYRITPPAAVPAGGQYAAIFAETINDEVENGDINGIYTVSRLALLLYGRSNEGVVIDSAITSYEVRSFLLSGPITANAKVKALGNVDVNATFKMSVKGLFGNELYSNSWTYPVLPETERFVSMSWEDTPGFGFYFVDFSVATSDHQESHTTFVLVYPIYMIIITLLLLTIIIIWIIIVLKKRKERKSRLIV